jgi:hypothetical protein
VGLSMGKKTGNGNCFGIKDDGGAILYTTFPPPSPHSQGFQGREAKKERVI